MRSTRDAVLLNYPRDNAAFPEASPGDAFPSLSYTEFHKVILGLSNTTFVAEAPEALIAVPSSFHAVA
jgi:hypothetical protein